MHAGGWYLNVSHAGGGGDGGLGGGGGAGGEGGGDGWLGGGAGGGLATSSPPELPGGGYGGIGAGGRLQSTCIVTVPLDACPAQLPVLVTLNTYLPGPSGMTLSLDA